MQSLHPNVQDLTYYPESKRESIIYVLELLL